MVSQNIIFFIFLFLFSLSRYERFGTLDFQSGFSDNIADVPLVEDAGRSVFFLSLSGMVGFSATWQ